MKYKDHDFNVSTGLQIKETRESLDIPLTQLAQSVGVTRQTMYRYERGNTAIPVHLFIFIAHILGVPAIKLLPDSYNSFKPNKTDV